MTNPFAGKPVRAALFASVERADEAVGRLLHAGFRQDEITVICSDACQQHFEKFKDTQRAEESHGGPVTGGLAGLAVGGLVSLGIITTGGVAIAAVGPLIAGGITGTLLGALVSRGVEDELARFYDQGVSEGQILIAVEPAGKDVDERLAAAERIFAETGAEPFELREQ